MILNNLITTAKVGAIMKIIEKLIKRASHKALGDLADDENYIFARKNYLFKEISAEAFIFVMTRLVERRYSQDELIFKQGNLGISLFLVKQGTVDIYVRTTENDHISFAVVEEGGVFGEMSLISSSYRTATAKADDNDTVLLTLSTFDINALADLYPEDGLNILKGITNTISENLIRTTKKLRSAEIKIQSLQEKLEKHERG